MSEQEAIEPEAPTDMQAEPAPLSAAEPQSEEVTEPVEADAEPADDDTDADGIEFDFGGTKARFARDASVAEAAEALQGYAKQVTAGANQKFQEAAEIRKTAEAARSALDELSELNTDALESYAQAAQLRDRVRALEGVDMPRLWQSDPDRARRLSDELARLRQQQDRAMDRLDQVQSHLRTAQGAWRQRAMAEGRQRVGRMDPGFATQADEVVAYVQQAYGLPAEQAQAWPLAPEMAVMARKAMLWDRAQAATKSRGPKPEARSPGPVRSLSGTGGGAAAGPHDRQGVESWMRARNRQLAARRG